MQATQSANKQAILAKLFELEDMLQNATCEGEAFRENLEGYDDWAAEVDSALRTLTEAVDEYLD